MARFRSYVDRLADANIEVFRVPDDYQPERDDGTPCEDGFYWWSCCLGCLPDGEPIGPFDTFNETARDALEGI